MIATPAQILWLYINKSIPKKYTLSIIAKTFLTTTVFTPSEKQTALSNWKSIYLLSPVTTDLTTSSATKDGEYSSIVAKAVSLSVSTTAYITATNAVRAYLWGTTGILLSMDANSTVTPGSYDALLAAYRTAHSNLVSAIDAKTAANAEAAAALDATNKANAAEAAALDKVPGYAGTVQTVPTTAAVVIIKGPVIGNVTVNQGDWVLMTASGTTWTQGSCYRWTGHRMDGIGCREVSRRISGRQCLRYSFDNRTYSRHGILRRSVCESYHGAEGGD